MSQVNEIRMVPINPLIIEEEVEITVVPNTDTEDDEEGAPLEPAPDTDDEMFGGVIPSPDLTSRSAPPPPLPQNVVNAVRDRNKLNTNSREKVDSYDFFLFYPSTSTMASANSTSTLPSPSSTDPTSEVHHRNDHFKFLMERTIH